MYGRSGLDQFARFLLIAALVFVVLSSLFRGTAVGAMLSSAALAALVYGIFRMCSRNLYARQRENAWYLRRRTAFLDWARSVRDRWQQRKDYRFFRCPSCKTLLRVPKNKGKLLLTCRKCGNRFERRT